MVHGRIEHRPATEEMRAAIKDALCAELCVYTWERFGGLEGDPLGVMGIDAVAPYMMRDAVDHVAHRLGLTQTRTEYEAGTRSVFYESLFLEDGPRRTLSAHWDE